MDKIKFRYILFFVMLLAQLYIPAKMVWDSEQVIAEGTEHKFLLRPVDPVDFFRGKYITLSYVESRFTRNQSVDFEDGSKVYCELGIGLDGFTQVLFLHESQEMVGDADYFEAVVRYTTGNLRQNVEKVVHLEFPFERYYMNEGKAKAAEDLARAKLIEEKNVVYGVVLIKDGSAVLDKVYINDDEISTLIDDVQ